MSFTDSRTSVPKRSSLIGIGQKEAKSRTRNAANDMRHLRNIIRTDYPCNDLLTQIKNDNQNHGDRNLAMFKRRHGTQNHEREDNSAASNQAIGRNRRIGPCSQNSRHKNNNQRIF